MSYKSEAQDKIAAAQYHIQRALKELSFIEVDGCEGYDKLPRIQEINVNSAFKTLLELSRSL